MKREIYVEIKNTIQKYTLQKKGISSECADQEKYENYLIDQIAIIVKNNQLSQDDLEKVRTELRKSLSDDQANDIWEKLYKKLMPYLQLFFFQKLNVKKQHVIAESIYKNTIIINNLEKTDLAKELGVSTDEISACRKAFNTIMYWITIENISEKRAENEVELLFGFNHELSHYLVSMMFADKSELRMIMLLRYISEIEDRLEPIEDLFRSVLEEDDENSDE